MGGGGRAGAAYDSGVTMDAGALEPMITYGTNPGMGVAITAPIPDPARVADPMARDSIAKALKYMGLEGIRQRNYTVDMAYRSAAAHVVGVSSASR